MKARPLPIDPALPIRLVLDSNLADDVVQEAWTAVLAKRPFTVPQGGPPRLEPWELSKR